MGTTGGATRICMISNPTSGNNRKWQARIVARLAAYPQVAHHVTRMRPKRWFRNWPRPARMWW